MKEPAFVPKPGQVDYTKIRYCPVVNCVVRHGDEVLLQRRSPGMRLYPGCWSGVSGFLDTSDDIQVKIYEELEEEYKLDADDVANIRIGRVIVQEAPDYGKTWIVFPAEVILKKKVEPQLNWEVAEARWLKPSDARQLDLLPGFEAVLAAFFDI